ncbi:3-methyladenine DNA glycosylase/8-oxoguanine DNA glycosylase [Kineococcus xinjiangensis]|uniref:3-methyladenine DNA glycosylase/8-oxoguanine DNA glycosylase n=1 Tax=Kineococcus xinjiangensis TaxID=512762 RepID=A0A2S6IUA2_9ACTN|nr:DNA-3-methyladenine glycosylase 2 family protein [Kineococcus xinjiangensis]PPK97798.1 3-methyladenine DNA glycosylase/8-oxoguanine DNA glycosylase [Kineococcus xinjiangensis]
MTALPAEPLDPPRVLRWRPGRPVDVPLHLSALRRGGSDPAFASAGGVVWRATRTPEGPATLRIVAVPGDGEVEAAAWGPGAEWALDGVPGLLGACDDDAAEFVPRPEHRVLVEAWRRHRDWRVPRSRAVFECISASALEQVVSTREAFASWRWLVRRFGEPAPGPVDLFVPPAPEQWRRIPSWAWLEAGVELRRRRVTLAAAPCAGRLEQTLDLAPAVADRALRTIPGLGVWTSAEVRSKAHGHADAFSFGDLHVAREVSYALTGEVLDDYGCAEVIECYRGHRYRVQRLVMLSGVRRPRAAPRMAFPTHTPSRTVPGARARRGRP